MTRDIPMRQRPQKKLVEDDAIKRSSIASQFTIPDGSPCFKAGYRECIEMFALHASNKRFVGKILDDHCITLENACILSNMARDNLAQYEGYRQAMKDLKRLKKIR